MIRNISKPTLRIDEIVLMKVLNMISSCFIFLKSASILPNLKLLRTEIIPPYPMLKK